MNPILIKTLTDPNTKITENPTDGLSSYSLTRTITSTTRVTAQQIQIAIDTEQGQIDLAKSSIKSDSEAIASAQADIPVQQAKIDASTALIATFQEKLLQIQSAKVPSEKPLS